MSFVASEMVDLQRQSHKTPVALPNMNELKPDDGILHWRALPSLRFASARFARQACPTWIGRRGTKLRWWPPFAGWQRSSCNGRAPRGYAP